jgi:anti-anti-sigma factor
MKTTIHEQDGNMVAMLEGILDTAAAPETQKAMSPLNDVEGMDIILDCTKLEYISSSGLRIFLDVLKSAEDKGRHVYIKGISDDVRAVFAITGFINLFEFL